MPQPAAGGAALGLTGAPQQGVPDPNAPAGQAGQAQWGGADPNSYYSNYWGGELTYPILLISEVLIFLVTGYYGQQPAAGQQGATTDTSMPGQA
jgi:nucleolysin TIA-1/TIAR